MFRIPTGRRAWIEDVVVDSAQRGKGVGEALTREALRVAQAAGATTVDLTSRPSREAANRLYQRIGFREARDECLSLHADGTMSDPLLAGRNSPSRGYTRIRADQG